MYRSYKTGRFVKPIAQGRSLVSVTSQESCDIHRRGHTFNHALSEPVWPSGKVRRSTSIPRRLLFLFKVVLMDILFCVCVTACALTINETLRWLSGLPILMQKSF